MKGPKVLLGSVMKTWINLLGQFVVMNMYVDFREDSMQSNELWEEYDFIVGGGSAGSVVASRLSEILDFSVLLLEVGGDETITTKIPWFHAQLPGSNLDWQFRTVPQEGILLGYENQISRWPRGRVIGGTSSINTMIYMRGNRNDYDRWSNEGNYGWAYEDVLPYFRKSQHQTDPILSADLKFHGNKGPLVVQNSQFLTPLMNAFLKAGELLGYRVGDPNGDIQNGFSSFQMTINGGKRWSTATAFIRPILHRKNLHVSLHSRVHEILFEENDGKKRAVGVEYLSNGKIKTILCRKEIILSAGTVLTPQLLMLSGIGPADHLQKLGISVRADLPVGQNLQDHLGAFGLSWTVKTGGYSLKKLANPLALTHYKLYGNGPFAATVGVEGNAFLSSGINQTKDDWPDLQIFFLSLTPAIDGGSTFSEYIGLSKEMWNTYYRPIEFRKGFSLVPVLLRPHSKGSIKLRSRNPYDMPIINPNYLTDPRDFEVMKKGLKLALQIGSSKSFVKYGAKIHKGILPGCPTLEFGSDDYWMCFIRHTAQTEHHVVGTCKMGPSSDSQAVVDHELRVYGVSGLRVVDGSIMPYVVSSNTNAPIIMIAEKASDLIKDAWLMSAKEIFNPTFKPLDSIINSRMQRS